MLDERKKHAASEAPKPAVKAVKTSPDAYGDELDVPRRADRPAAVRTKAPAGKKKKGKKKRRGLTKLFGGLSRAKVQIARSTDSRRRFRGVMVGSHLIGLWWFVALAVIVALAVGIRMSNGNATVDQQQVTIVGLSGDLEGFRMLVISDLNGKRFGDRQSALMRTINNLSYDAVFLLGDMVGRGGDPEPLYELIESLPKSKPIYFICGDSDPGPYLKAPRDITGTLRQLVLEDWILGAIERGAVYVDSPVDLPVGQSHLWITPATLLNMDAGELQDTWRAQTEQEKEGVLSGLESDYTSLPLTTYRTRIAENLYAAVGSIAQDDFVLCLSHEVPADKTIETASGYTSSDDKFMNAPELVLAGHYCGGVWRIPGYGAFYIPDRMLPRSGWFPAQTRAQGLSSVGVSQVYITGGLSTNADVRVMPFRLGNSPQISLLTLTATLPENMLEAG
ncbi:MAG: metallophosphoesterase [Clostridiales bacterium]|nr:metallophosphoesterase [Clostridiales bacterium]